MNQKWYDKIQFEPMIWFGFFVVLLFFALFAGEIDDTTSKLLFMGATLCAARIRSPVSK